MRPSPLGARGAAGGATAGAATVAGATAAGAATTAGRGATAAPSGWRLAPGGRLVSPDGGASTLRGEKTRPGIVRCGIIPSGIWPGVAAP